MNNERTSKEKVLRWTDHGVSGVMPPVEVVAASDYDDLKRKHDQWQVRAERICNLILRLNTNEGLSPEALAGLQRLARGASPASSNESPGVPGETTTCEDEADFGSSEQELKDEPVDSSCLSSGSDGYFARESFKL